MCVVAAGDRRTPATRRVVSAPTRFPVIELRSQVLHSFLPSLLTKLLDGKLMRVRGCARQPLLTHTSCWIHRTNFGTCQICCLFRTSAHCDGCVFLCAVYVHSEYSDVVTYLFTLCWPSVNSVDVYTCNYQLNSPLVSNFIVLLYSY